MKPGPHELAQQHPKKRCQNESRNAPNDAPPPQKGRQNNKSVGADFRYAVEFSKYGRTPAPVSQPAWGQPWKHYPVRFAVSNCPARSALFTATGAQLTDPCGCGLRGVSLPGPLKDRSGATWRTVRSHLLPVKPPAVPGFSLWRPPAAGGPQPRHAVPGHGAGASTGWHPARCRGAAQRLRSRLLAAVCEVIKRWEWRCRSGTPAGGRCRAGTPSPWPGRFP